MSVTTKKNRKSRIKVGMLSAFLTVGLCSTNANAIPVFDPTNFVQNLMTALNSMEEVESLVEQLSVVKDQLGVLQQQLTQMQNFTSGGMNLSTSMTPRKKDAGMETRCPDAPSSFGFDLLSTIFKVDLDGNIPQQQQEVCARIVYAENDKFNRTVDLLQKLEQMGREYNIIDSGRAGVGESSGGLQTNTNDAIRFTAELQTEVSYWDANNKALDVYIQGLYQEQEVLAQRAMRGTNRRGLHGVVGSAIQGALLEGALELND
jgi:hypothetical protein